MRPSPTIARPSPQSWTYASLTVIDGQRELKPAQVASDRLLFAEPPHLTSEQVEIVLTNGQEVQRHAAVVLPHASDATRIPIRLMPAQIRGDDSSASRNVS